MSNKLQREIERQDLRYRQYETKLYSSKFDDAKDFETLLQEQQTMTKELELRPSHSGFMQVDTLDKAMEIANLISKTSFCPKAMTGKPSDIVLALQLGQELGLKPLQSIQNIAIINGRPSLWGDALLAVCRQSPSFEYIKEEYLNESNSYVCRVKRRDEPEFLQTFSEADARLAKLWGKPGPWTEYPRRMLQMRARGFALRDAFPDLLRGIITVEEASDIPRKDYSTSTGSVIEGEPVVIVKNEPYELSHISQQALMELMQQTGTDLQQFCQYFEVNELRELTQDQYEKALAMLNKKLAKSAEIL
jgi:hypothetical protein